MKDRLLLINPWIYDFSAYDFGMKPVGLLKIGALLRKEYEISFIDCLSGCARSRKESGFSKIKKEKVEKPHVLKCVSRPYFRYGISIEEFKEKLSRLKKPDAIFITSGMTYWYPGVKLAIEIIKSFFPHIPVTLGGIYATLCHEHARLHSGADRVFRGNFIDNSDEPIPLYELMDEHKVLPIMTSRGCPFRCTYCASNIFYPDFHQRDPVEVFEEIMYYRRKFGTRNFVFYDDALIFNSDSGIKSLLRIIKSHGEKFKFYTTNGIHTRFIDMELALLMKETGFTDIRISLETSRPDIQTLTGGKVNNSDVKRAVTILKEAGFEKRDIGIYILVGGPWFDLETAKEDVIFVSSLGARAILASYSLIPGTMDYEAMIEGEIIPEDLDPLWHNKAVFSELIRPGSAGEISELRRFASRINV